MQSRSRLQSILATLALHLGAAALIGYFAYHAYNGDHGLVAKRNYEQEMKALEAELAGLKAQRRAMENKVSLLAPTQLDPDMLDEEARRQLNFINGKDLVLLRSK
ncbi:FtsB family cell division protein [Xanthobacter versatilis]|uniref:Septum formation initiator n=1 Tax=Xanthobacter autotrophicus (strain ATCC BAA-1158 / Py2) TaxID=78245 RepID=A7IM68_XANP2|nr:Septum formation initiator [Xanthobacter autotrophicus Py2]